MQHPRVKKSKNIRDLYRGMIGFKSSYQPRNNLVKDENVDLLADSHNIFIMWKKYFSQLLNGSLLLYQLKKGV
jgi:hypothetical protein